MVKSGGSENDKVQYMISDLEHDKIISLGYSTSVDFINKSSTGYNDDTGLYNYEF